MKHQTSSRPPEFAVLYKPTACPHLYRANLGLRTAAKGHTDLGALPVTFFSQSLATLNPHCQQDHHLAGASTHLPQIRKLPRVTGTDNDSSPKLLFLQGPSPAQPTAQHLEIVVSHSLFGLYCLEWRGKPNICYSIIAKV